jgi:3-phenylpropionate/trans-cinnamate dioxygenase ferredoxin reductase component
VGGAALGLMDSYRCLPWYWTDQHGMNVQVTGYADDIDTTIWRGQGDSKLALHFKGPRLVAATAINRAKDIRPVGKLILNGWEGDSSVFSDESKALASICRGIAG